MNKKPKDSIIVGLVIGIIFCLIIGMIIYSFYEDKEKEKIINRQKAIAWNKLENCKENFCLSKGMNKILNYVDENKEPSLLFGITYIYPKMDNEVECFDEERELHRFITDCIS